MVQRSQFGATVQAAYAAMVVYAGEQFGVGGKVTFAGIGTVVYPVQVWSEVMVL